MKKAPALQTLHREHIFIKLKLEPNIISSIIAMFYRGIQNKIPALELMTKTGKNCRIV
jgi:hypothetical protein